MESSKTDTKTDTKTVTETEVTETQSTKKKRCLVCNKKVGLTGFTCRCGGLFCGSHRSETQHACTFNFAEASNAMLETKLIKVDNSRNGLII